MGPKLLRPAVQRWILWQFRGALATPLLQQPTEQGPILQFSNASVHLLTEKRGSSCSGAISAHLPLRYVNKLAFLGSEYLLSAREIFQTQEYIAKKANILRNTSKIVVLQLQVHCSQKWRLFMPALAFRMVAPIFGTIHVCPDACIDSTSKSGQDCF